MIAPGPLGKLHIAFIGAGKMAEAIAKGLLNAHAVSPERIWAADPDGSRRDVFAALGARVAEQGADLLGGCDVVLLAVKPQKMAEALEGLRPAFRADRHLAVSIAAGITLSRLGDLLPEGARIVRAMPNTPLQVGRGATALARGRDASDADLAVARALFESSGETVVVEERQMDAVTAVSGSGPAYAFLLAECMIEAGVAEGLEHALASRLAAATLEGAGRLLLESGEEPAELRRRVTSPGGTTEAALAVLERAGVRNIIVEAVRRAAERSAELSGSR